MFSLAARVLSAVKSCCDRGGSEEEGQRPVVGEMLCMAWPETRIHKVYVFKNGSPLDNEYPLRRELHLDLGRAGLWGKSPHLIVTEQQRPPWGGHFSSRARGSQLVFRGPRSGLPNARTGLMARAGSPCALPSILIC